LVFHITRILRKGYLDCILDNAMSMFSCRDVN